MKQEDYVSFEVAKLLKEKGYAEPSKYYYRKFEKYEQALNEGIKEAFKLI